MKRAARKASDTHTVHGFARFGFVILGVLHLMIGGIAIAVALQVADAEADQSGALKSIADTSVGGVILWIVAFGMLALAIWEVVRAVALRDKGRPARWGKRIAGLARAVAYLVIASSAFIFAFGGRTSSSETSQTLSAWALSLPGGVFALLAVAGTIIGIGGFFVFRGISRRFHQDIDAPSGPTGVAVTTLGLVGYVAEGVALLTVGILLAIGAITFDSSKSRGLDGALRSLTQLPYGQVILVITGIGLLAYGFYCMARARYAKL